MYTFLVALPRAFKRRALFLLDVGLVPVSILLAFCLRYGVSSPVRFIAEAPGLLLTMTLAAVLVLLASGIARIKLQNLELRAVMAMGLTSAVLAAVAVLASYMLQVGTPRSVPLIFGVIYFVLILGMRLAIIAVLGALQDMEGGGTRVVIYGAGSEGIQIASALRASGDLRPVAFVDDNAAFHGVRIAGLNVRSPSDLPKLIQQHAVEKVILALPSMKPGRKEDLVRELRGLGCDVQMLPSHAELLARGDIADKLRTVHPDELLGRDKVDLNVPAVAKAYAGRHVMVTGAGGSIGSELCRQLIDCRPSRIILFEHSEYALYEIDRELRSMLPEGTGIEIRTRLGSVTNPARVRDVMTNDEVEFVLHAAAYKHVPLVEGNELEGARNNVLGTRIVAETAIECGIERFILISTDKAVRPTNVMGATKRLAELVVQDLQSRAPATKLAMVRFGNVLGSSGSVLPLFQRQIDRGGPVTVTHPEVTRFFMTIPEAARLVLLAGAFARNADLFVLDMGEPVKIMDIAQRMIELSGQTLRSADSPDGIEIRVTGLRPGEKLYEELLIDTDALIATPHGKILRAQEAGLSQIEVSAMLREITTAIEAGQPARVRAAIERYVDGYHMQPLAQAT